MTKVPEIEIQPFQEIINNEQIIASQEVSDQTINCLIVFILRSWTPDVVLFNKNGEFECGLVFKGTLNE